LIVVSLIKRLTDRLAVSQLMALTLLSLVATFFAVVQAISIGWLASFPAATQVDQMKVGFWLFVVLACLLAIVDLLLLAIWIVRIRRVRAARRRERGAA